MARACSSMEVPACGAAAPFMSKARAAETLVEVCDRTGSSFVFETFKTFVFSQIFDFRVIVV